MAKLGVTAAGAVVGGVLGSFVGNPMLGAQIGWAVGGLASSFVGNKDQQGPRVAELTIQGSAYGNPIPLVSARAKLAGNVIWCDDIIERKSKKKAGKGGPKVTFRSSRRFATRCSRTTGCAPCSTRACRRCSA